MLKSLNNLFGNIKKTPDLEIQTFLEGETVSLKDVPDQIFSKKILGAGIAVMPSKEVLMAPVDGTVAAVMTRTRHSCCIRGDRGLEVLLHIGVNTVEMNGDGFELLVTNGQKVKAGDPLITFSLEKIKEAGLPVVSSLIITEMGEYHRASFHNGMKVKKGDVIASLFF